MMLNPLRIALPKRPRFFWQQLQKNKSRNIIRQEACLHILRGFLSYSGQRQHFLCRHGIRRFTSFISEYYIRDILQEEVSKTGGIGDKKHSLISFFVGIQRLVNTGTEFFLSLMVMIGFFFCGIVRKVGIHGRISNNPHIPLC